MAHDSDGTERHLKAASDAIRKDVLPVLGEAYDKSGPAAVLMLTMMLADSWLEAGFTAGDWRAIIDIYDLQTGAEALRRR